MQSSPCLVCRACLVGVDVIQGQHTNRPSVFQRLHSLLLPIAIHCPPIARHKVGVPLLRSQKLNVCSNLQVLEMHTTGCVSLAVLTMLLSLLLQGRNGAVLSSRGNPGTEAPASQGLVYPPQPRCGKQQGRPTS